MEELQIRKLTDAELAALHDSLGKAATWLDHALPIPCEKVQELFDVLVADHPSYEAGPIVLGLTFGELLREARGYEWVRVVDDWGEETALAVPSSQIVCYPISMIQKRLESAESTQISELLDSTLEKLDGIIQSGDYVARSTD